MTATYDLIASNVLSSSASSVTFSSIPATYRDLVLVFDGKNAGGGTSGRMQFNGDTGSNYSLVSMYGNGSSTSSGSYASDDHIAFSYFVNLFNTIQISTIQIMDYSATDKHKTVLVRNNKADDGVEAIAGRWANTAAINSIRLYQPQFAIGSSFYLYGIAS